MTILSILSIFLKKFQFCVVVFGFATFLRPLLKCHKNSSGSHHHIIVIIEIEQQKQSQNLLPKISTPTNKMNQRFYNFCTDPLSVLWLVFYREVMVFKVDANANLFSNRGKFRLFSVHRSSKCIGRGYIQIRAMSKQQSVGEREREM